MKWDRFCQKTFFHITAIDHGEISGKKPVIAGVAQLVEHPICNRAVGSSSLSASTISPIAPCVKTLICIYIHQLCGVTSMLKHFFLGQFPVLERYEQEFSQVCG